MATSTHPSYLRPVLPTPQYSPWTSAVMGFGIGYVLRLVLTHVLGVLGLVSALFARGSDPSFHTVAAWVAVGYLSIVATAALGVGKFLHRQGARRPFVAALAGGFGGLLAGELAGLVMPGLNFVVGAVVEVVAIASLTRTPTPAAGHQPAVRR